MSTVIPMDHIRAVILSRVALYDWKISRQLPLEAAQYSPNVLTASALVNALSSMLGTSAQFYAARHLADKQAMSLFRFCFSCKRVEVGECGITHVCNACEAEYLKLDAIAVHWYIYSFNIFMNMFVCQSRRSQELTLDMIAHRYRAQRVAIECAGASA